MSTSLDPRRFAYLKTLIFQIHCLIKTGYRNCGKKFYSLVEQLKTQNVMILINLKKLLKPGLLNL